MKSMIEWRMMHRIGSVDFAPLSSHCLLVDIDVYYDASRIGSIDLNKTTTDFKSSYFTQYITNTWPKSFEGICDDIKVIFDDVTLKKRSSSGYLVLAATYLYEFEIGVKGIPSDRKLTRCINSTREKHNKHVDKFNWLTIIPKLKGKDGRDVEAEKAPYDSKFRHCCMEKRNGTCCPEGAMFVGRGESSFCDCKQGYFHHPATPLACHPCPIDTYQAKPNMQNCPPCPSGKMTLGEGSTSCVPIIECKREVIWTVKGTFTWKATRVNKLASHKCPYGPGNVTLSRNCSWISNTAASWTVFDSSGCNPSKHTETLLELSKTPIDETNVNNITEVLVGETEAPDELDSYDVALVTTTISDIVDYNSSLAEVAENVLQVIDNILSVSEEILAESELYNQTTSRLLNVTETFAENVPLEKGIRLLVGENIKIKAESIAQEFVGDDLTYVANVTTRNSSLTTQTEIKISKNAIQQAKQQGSDRVITIVYQNNKLFPVSVDKSLKNGIKRKRNVGNIILSGKFKEASIEMVNGAIELIFPNKMKSDDRMYFPRCVYWDFTANDGFGNWSSEGCFYEGTKSGHVTCRCNHMTHFAILLTADPDRDVSDSDHSHALSVISYIGCGISLLAAILTLITYVYFRDLKRSNAQTILCHLCVALIGLLVTYFIVATRDPKTTGCLVSGLLVHFFLLATFSWMAVEGINMYLAFVKVMSAHVPRFVPKAVLIAWGFPGVVVVVTGALAFDYYSTDESCFLHGIAFYISVFAPAAFVLFMNFIMFVLTMYSLSQMGKEVSQENKMTGYHRVKVALAITVLLGLTWFFGTLAIGSARLVFQYLFCIFNSLQGFAIFWFHCVRQPEVRQCWADFLRGRRGRQRRYTASTTAPALATNAVKKSSSATASPRLSPFNSRGKYNIEQKKISLDRNHNTANSL
ncbi:adhesion G-protein coupled receptor G4-like isoform X2 [Dendronephthya gigantea]|uniref:adhesion G-protein coupled receptor G4-like isoform X2 n=1 Tax=Dendronephthya gigantea TaxID=151771 RepID=UPI00106A4477|nr:adhesion G-protein coupled receptor G4-like isoform X2 [Dendronephthya gigantea]